MMEYINESHKNGKNYLSIQIETPRKHGNITSVH